MAAAQKCRSLATGEVVAIKQINKYKIRYPPECDMMAEEIRAMRMVDHNNCVRLIEVLETQPCLHLVLEYVEGCDLLEKIQLAGTFTEEDARLVIAGVSQALQVS